MCADRVCDIGGVDGLRQRIEHDETQQTSGQDQSVLELNRQVVSHLLRISNFTILRTQNFTIIAGARYIQFIYQEPDRRYEEPGRRQHRQCENHEAEVRENPPVHTGECEHRCRGKSHLWRNPLRNATPPGNVMVVRFANQPVTPCRRDDQNHKCEGGRDGVWAPPDVRPPRRMNQKVFVAPPPPGATPSHLDDPADQLHRQKNHQHQYREHNLERRPVAHHHRAVEQYPARAPRRQVTPVVAQPSKDLAYGKFLRCRWRTTWRFRWRILYVTG